MAVESCEGWGRDHSFWRMWLLASFLCSRGWPHTHAHMGSTNWAALTGLSGLSKKKTEKKVGREMCWKDMGELEEGMGINMIIFHFMPVWKSQK